MKKEKKKTNISVAFRLIKLMFQEKKGYLLLYILLYATASSLEIILGIYASKDIIDLIMVDASIQTMVIHIAVIFGIMLLSGAIVRYLDTVFFSLFIPLRISQFKLLNEKNLMIDYPYCEDAKFKDELEVASEALDGDEVGVEGFYANLPKILSYILQSICYFVMLFFFNYIVVIACLLGAVVSTLVKRAIAKYVDRKKEELASASRKKKYFYDTCYDFTYGKDIRVYSLKDKLIGDYKKKSNSYLDVLRAIQNRRLLLALLEILMLLLQDGAAYVLVVYAYFKQGLSLADVALYIGTVIALSQALRSFSTEAGLLIKNLAYTKTYFDFMDNQRLIKFDKEAEIFPKNETLEITFEHVSFKYPNTDQYIFKDLNFTIHKGEKLAIVGVNGAGKSTLVKLITGLFVPTDGHIYINGIDQKKFATVDYWKMFSIVYQDVNIYGLSVLENVLGSDTKEEDIERAKDCIARVGLKDKIESLPNQYDTILNKVLDDNGIELSGGQNQKLAIARALYKDGNMVILDEPTAALDALAEAEIYQSFDDLVSHKTALYISHRLSSTKFCDKIALFSKDGLIEYGSHDELMALQGVYYDMFETQGKYYKEGANIDEE